MELFLDEMYTEFEYKGIEFRFKEPTIMEMPVIARIIEELKIGEDMENTKILADALQSFSTATNGAKLANVIIGVLGKGDESAVVLTKVLSYLFEVNIEGEWRKMTAEELQRAKYLFYLKLASAFFL